jgi:hypothetical protein
MEIDIAAINLPYRIQRQVQKYTPAMRATLITCLKAKMAQSGTPPSWGDFQDCVARTMQLSSPQPNYAEIEASHLQYERGEVSPIGDILDE